MSLLFNSDIVNLLLKNIGGDRRPNVAFCSLEYFNCRSVGGGVVGQKVLFRAG